MYCCCTKYHLFACWHVLRQPCLASNPAVDWAGSDSHVSAPPKWLWAFAGDKVCCPPMSILQVLLMRQASMVPCWVRSYTEFCIMRRCIGIGMPTCVGIVNALTVMWPRLGRCFRPELLCWSCCVVNLQSWLILCACRSTSLTGSSSMWPCSASPSWVWRLAWPLLLGCQLPSSSTRQPSHTLPCLAVSHRPLCTGWFPLHPMHSLNAD